MFRYQKERKHAVLDKFESDYFVRIFFQRITENSLQFVN